MGGTNAHAILEEAPVLKPVAESKPWKLLVLSARTSLELESVTLNLVTYLRQHPELNLDDAAYTSVVSLSVETLTMQRLR
jgi:acyl transferase domain-containing protein